MAPYAEAPTLVPAGAKTMCRRQACSDCLAHRHSPAVLAPVAKSIKMSNQHTFWRVHSLLADGRLDFLDSASLAFIAPG